MSFWIGIGWLVAMLIRFVVWWLIQEKTIVMNAPPGSDANNVIQLFVALCGMLSYVAAIVTLLKAFNITAYSLLDNNQDRDNFRIHQDLAAACVCGLCCLVYTGYRCAYNFISIFFKRGDNPDTNNHFTTGMWAVALVESLFGVAFLCAYIRLKLQLASAARYEPDDNYRWNLRLVRLLALLWLFEDTCWPLFSPRSFNVFLKRISHSTEVILLTFIKPMFSTTLYSIVWGFEIHDREPAAGTPQQHGHDTDEQHNTTHTQSVVGSTAASSVVSTTAVSVSSTVTASPSSAVDDALLAGHYKEHKSPPLEHKEDIKSFSIAVHSSSAESPDPESDASDSFETPHSQPPTQADVEDQLHQAASNVSLWGLVIVLSFLVMLQWVEDNTANTYCIPQILQLLPVLVIHWKELCLLWKLRWLDICCSIACNDCELVVSTGLAIVAHVTSVILMFRQDEYPDESTPVEPLGCRITYTIVVLLWMLAQTHYVRRIKRANPPTIMRQLIQRPWFLMVIIAANSAFAWYALVDEGEHLHHINERFERNSNTTVEFTEGLFLASFFGTLEYHFATIAQVLHM